MARLRLPFRRPTSGLAIVPTVRCVGLLLGLAPLGLLVATVAPQGWAAVPALALGVVALALADGVWAGALARLDLATPPDAEVGHPAPLTLQARFTRAARQPQAALGLDTLLAADGAAFMTLEPEGEGLHRAVHPLTPTRRGTGRIHAVWLRWQGPLGLGARQHRQRLDHTIAVRPSLAPLRDPALQARLREAEAGMVERRKRGEGSLFETLTDYHPGMDRRRIDWKVSARHAHLYAREYESERNHPIALVVDCGRAMGEPVGGVPRMDRAISAALTLAHAALRWGDRPALMGFDASVQLATPFLSGPGAFTRLHQAAARLDYTPREPNFTLALATLAGRLTRRALVVVFSEFPELASAELLIESLGRLLAQHRVVFVTLADEELATLSTASPDTAAALAGAVAAGTLLRERALVIARLRQMGVEVVEAPHALLSTRLLNTYLAIRRSGELG